MKNESQSQGMNRREFLKTSAGAGVGAATLTGALVGCQPNVKEGQTVLAAPTRNLGPAPQKLFTAPPMDRVRIGFVGVGGMGSAHVRSFLRIENVEVKAVCDIVEEKVQRIQKWTVEAGQPEPTGYSRGEEDFKRMCETEELDLVFTATPWRWHVPVCIAAMENGKHAATEVPAAVTIDECWQLVETAEKRGKHCLMMENCNYGRRELLILNLVRKGLLGEVMHTECGYLHDLRGVKFDYNGEGLWRREHSKTRNGNLYPTHGLGPVAQCMDINRGDQFDYLVSMSSNSRGLQEYVKNTFPEGSAEHDETYRLGDVNVTLIKTVKGRTIYLNHDTNLPRPYSRLNIVQGTKGLVEGYPDRIHIEGRSPGHGWEELDSYYEEFDHPLWKGLQEKSKGAGHGGMDFVEDYRLVQCLLKGWPLDMDVYDAAALSAISELTEISVANGSMPIKCPDFTRGMWQKYPSLGIVEA